MSRAFTKETDEPTPALADRPVSAARNLVTATGAIKIEGEIASLLDRLARTSDAEGQSSLKRDLRYWEARKASMEVVQVPDAPTEVGFGTTVAVERDGKPQEISIVGEDEADPPIGAIAWTAPLAKALDAAKVGESVLFELPSRQEEVRVMAIRPYRPGR